MAIRTFMTSCGAVLMISSAGAGLWATSVIPASADSRFLQTNLVSNGAIPALITDPNLVNAWGISESPKSPFWISDNGAGVSTLYSVPATGGPPVSKVNLTVTIPPTSGATVSAPTGQVFNGGVGFGGALFLFDSEDGVISGWSGGTSAVKDVDKGAAAVYKGLAISNPGAANAVLYATNFRAGTIDAFNNTFAPTLTGDFVDPNLPAGYAPFNDKVIDGELYVTYALQDAAKHDDQAGPGHGFVDIFNLDGSFDKRLISQGNLNSPWGMAIAPSGFGSFGGDLLVGNFGNGMINAYDPTTGAFEGVLDGANGNPLVIDGLWGLTFGNGAAGGSLNTLYFTAGPNGESNGLFGSLSAVPETSTWVMSLLGFGGLGLAAMQRRRAAVTLA